MAAGRAAAQVLVKLGQACSAGAAPAALRQAVAQDSVAGLFRDLRGIAMATNSRRTYGARFWSLLAGCSDCSKNFRLFKISQVGQGRRLNISAGIRAWQPAALGAKAWSLSEPIERTNRSQLIGGRGSSPVSACRG